LKYTINITKPRGKEDMERRKFLIRSSQLGVSVAASSMLVGCDGGSNDDVPSAPSKKISDIDQNIIALDAKQLEISTTHTKMQNSLNFANTDLDAAYIKASLTYPDDIVLTKNYLSDVNSNQNLWENAKVAHQIAYDQYNHQLTKLKASLRLFDHKNNSTEEVSKQAKTIDITVRRENIVDADDALNQFIDLLENLSIDNLGTTTLAFMEGLLLLIYGNLKSYIENGETQALDYAYLTYKAIETLLNLIKEKTLSDLSFNTPDDVVKSLAKITVASISVLGLASLKTLDIAKQDLSSEQQATQDFLTSNSLDSSVSSVWMGISSKITLGTIDELKNSLNAPQDKTEEYYSNLAIDLKSKSDIMAITSATIKALFGKSAEDAQNVSTGFTSGSTADTFKILFTSDKNPYDEALSKVDTTSYPIEDASFSSTPSFNITTDPEVREVTTTVENDAYQFATELASVSYNFVEDTESDAVDFATHLADLAYAFVMDIEEDAYQFAMQGMEYGYLFASRGEEVGLMADRILWMAVQIGVMADRIGEMADRIVYTEQLIVYTEILILDFGILIYGFGSQISNTMLTGLALIFDREWYTPESNDIVLESINANVLVMLDNMQEYALAVLEHQNDLRDSTLEALEVLPYAESESL
jgi:hypothetical protein